MLGQILVIISKRFLIGFALRWTRALIKEEIGMESRVFDYEMDMAELEEEVLQVLSHWELVTVSAAEERGQETLRREISCSCSAVFVTTHADSS